MRDVDITVGSDTSAVGAGMAELKNTVQRTMTDVRGLVTQAFTVGAIATFFTSIIEKAHDLHHESERFAVDAQQLQLIANAAKEDGIGIESVARAMNRLGIITPKTGDALAALNITMAEWEKMDLAQRFLAVADSIHTLGLNTDTYQAAATLLGVRFGTELLPLLQRGSEEILKLGGATTQMSNESIESLDRAYKAWENFKTNMQGNFAPVIAFVLNSLTSAFNTFGLAAQLAADGAVGGFQVIKLAATGNLGDAKAALESWRAEIRKDIEEWGKAQDKLGAPPTASPARTFGTEPETAGPGFGEPEGRGQRSEGGGQVRTGLSGEGGSREASSALDSLAAKQRQYDLDHLANEEKLQYLEMEREEIQTNLTNAQEQGVITTEEQAGYDLKLLQNDEDREKLMEEIAAQQQKITAEISLAREEAEKDAVALERRNILNRLVAEGCHEQAQQLAHVWQTQDEINDLLDQANDKWAEAARLEALGESELAQSARDIAQMNEGMAASIKDSEEFALNMAQAEAHLGNMVSQAQLLASGLEEGLNNLQAIFANAPRGATFEEALKIYQAQQADKQALLNFQYQSILDYYRTGGPQRILDYRASLGGSVQAGDFQTLDAILTQLQSIDTKLTPQRGSH
jgi:hypothetical protein